MLKNILETKNLKKYYTQNNYPVKAVDDISITVQEGEFVSIVGQSGSGKSTLLHMIGGLDCPTDGKVCIKGKDIFSQTEDDLAIFRRREIGFIFQYYNLIPALDVWENIVLPLGLDEQEVDVKYIDDLLKTLGIKNKKHASPNELSGGQQQRVAIARALACKPSIILADEPTGNLDSETETDVINLLNKTARKYHQTIIMITHNEEIAKSSDRIIILKDGKVIK